MRYYNVDQHSKNQVESLLTYTRDNGGVTFTIDAGDSLRFKVCDFNQGYQVANGTLLTIDLKDLSADMLAGILVDFFSIRLLSSVYYGFWIDEGVLYIDKSMHVFDYLQACDLASDLNEKAIYDWRNKICLRHHKEFMRIEEIDLVIGLYR